MTKESDRMLERQRDERALSYHLGPGFYNSWGDSSRTRDERVLKMPQRLQETAGKDAIGYAEFNQGTGELKFYDGPPPSDSKPFRP